MIILKVIMRICIDIDGTLCPIRQPHEIYKELIPFEGAVEKIKALKQQGAYIILCTARHMKTCESNIGRVIATQSQVLTEWLAKHDIPHDELWFGKPYAHIYIDDKAFQFKGSWDDITPDLVSTYL